MIADGISFCMMNADIECVHVRMYWGKCECIRECYVRIRNRMASPPQARGPFNCNQTGKVKGCSIPWITEKNIEVDFSNNTDQT